MNAKSAKQTTMAFLVQTPKLRIEEIRPRRRAKTEWVWRPGHKHMVRVPCVSHA